jgi:ribose 5-phosphate isomerase A
MLDMEVYLVSSAKLNAAKGAIELIPASGALGLGSGSTVAIFAEELGKRVAAGKADVRVVPSSYQAYQLAVEHKIPITNLDLDPVLVLTVDGADEVDKELNLTKGGGGALFQEKVVASASEKLVIIVDESKLVDYLGTKFEVPVEVLPFALGVVRRKITEIGISPTLRMAQKKMGPLVTDNGNFILDLKFKEPIRDPARTAVELKMVSGVVETGLFVGMTSQVIVGTEKGSYDLKR